MNEPIRKPQSPQRFFLNAPKQKDGECYVLNWDYMELDAYCVSLLQRIDDLTRIDASQKMKPSP